MRLVSIGWGGRLHLIDGAKCDNVNLTFVADPTAADPTSPWDASLSAVPGANWLDSIYGGNCSLHPGGFSNHKPGAWYHGAFYFAGYNVEDTPDLYLLTWDGSGIHKHGGFGADLGYTVAWRNGRGTELISPSGSHNVAMQSCAHVVHNGILFILGASPFFTTSDGSNPWRVKQGWDVDLITNAGDGDNRRNRRKYVSFGIDKQQKQAKDHKFISTPVEFLPNANGQEDTQACDAISFGDDIIFASYCDIVRFPGGSGTPTIIDSTLGEPSSKCFEIFPTSGFQSGSPIFSGERPDLLVLTGSGVIKEVNFSAGLPSGVLDVINLGEMFTDSNNIMNVRTTGPLARVSSSTDEPIRSCYLKSFNGNLHAFIPSATSGYHYVRCDGDPRLIANWTNKTNDLPLDFRKYDGDIYGYLDEFRNSLYVMHVTKSEYGLWGFVGGQKSAGGMSIYQIDANFDFTEIYRGMSAEPPVGLLPYNNLGVSAQCPSGNNPEVIASTDYALIVYKLYNPYPALCKVRIEYTVNDGITWHKARRFKSYDTATLLGDELTGLLASHFGEEYTFYWNHISDVGCNANKQARIRIIPELER